MYMVFMLGSTSLLQLKPLYCSIKGASSYLLKRLARQMATYRPANVMAGSGVADNINTDLHKLISLKLAPHDSAKNDATHHENADHSEKQFCARTHRLVLQATTV